MRCVNRSGNAINQNDIQNKILKFLYKNKLGRMLLKLLIRPWVSNVSGVVLNSSCSRILIPLFIKKYKIDIEEYEDCTYSSYNDFFTRKIGRASCRERV